MTVGVNQLATSVDLIGSESWVFSVSNLRFGWGLRPMLLV